MKLVVFGLTVTSSWGNGHATLWRGLLTSLAALGHEIVFFERDVAYYAAHRDLDSAADYRIELYHDWSAALLRARAALAGADVAIITSYCPDAAEAAELVFDSNVAVRVFYDLDTPVTLHRLREGETVSYIPPGGLEPFDLVLSYTGGRALDELRTRLGAREVAPLYGSVDPGVHQPASPVDHFTADLSYLGTYAADRQHALETLFLEPARALPEKRFLIGGAQYPQEFPWSSNVYFARHVAPPDHAAFYSSSRLTLNITRAAMADMGYCPSGRLFEAAACATPIVSDWWEGLDAFFDPHAEIVIATCAEDVVRALERPPRELMRLGAAARERVLAEHTAHHRALELIERVTGARSEPARALAGT
jgi:spore maturation protein CgeB